jgi:hypothetical protein
VSEAVFNIMQLGQQSDTTSAAAAKVLMPVDAGAVIDEDRAATSPDEDYGENAVGQPGRGTYGLRGSNLSVTGEVRAEDFIDILSMHAKGGVTSTGGAGAYVWTYPFDLTSDSLKRYTIEAGAVDTANDQWRAVGCLVDKLELGFDALAAPGNAPWKYSADIVGIYRERSDLTAALSPYSPLETLEGHMTDLYEGPTGTAYASLAQAAATLKSFKLTSDLKLIRRAYGGSADYASAWGYGGRKEIGFTAELAINATTHADVSDVFETAGSLMTERRWRILTRGSRLTTQNEIQVVTLNETPTGGTFTLAFEGATTTALPYNESSANVQTALRALATIGSPNVTVTGSAGGPYTVTFVSALASQPQLLIVGNGTLLTGAGNQPTVTVARSQAGGQLKTMTIDGRVRFHTVNIGDVDGERLFAVEGIYVKDPVANSGTGTDLRIELLNGIQTQLTLV